MKKTRKKSRREAGLPKEALAKYIPIDPEEFKFLIGELSLSVKENMPSDFAPSDFKIGISGMDNEQDSVRIYSFTDNPLNRAFLRIKTHYGDQRKDEAFSAMGRFFALGELFSNKKLIENGLIKNTNGESEVILSEAIIHLAAIEPLNDRLSFSYPGFLSKVIELHNQDEEPKN